jgi:hypothetical protein
MLNRGTVLIRRVLRLYSGFLLFRVPGEIFFSQT